MSSEANKILEFKQYQKSWKAPFFIYADPDCLMENNDGCKNNLENLSTIKVSNYFPSGFSMFAMFSFQIVENKHDTPRGKDCLEHRMEITSYKNKEMKLLTIFIFIFIFVLIFIFV